MNTITTSISHNNTGELSDTKCDQLMVTRVNNSALATPIYYMSEIARWIQHSLIHLHQLNVQINDLVCDFIKDDNDHWYLINVKGFRITEESIPRIRFWYVTKVLGKPESEANGGKEHQLTLKERHWKQTAQVGSQCRLCGVHYVENSFIAMPLSNKLRALFNDMERENKAKNNQWGNPVKDVPALDEHHMSTPEGEMVPVPVFGYQLTIAAATIVTFAYFRHQMALTRLAQILMEMFQLQSNQTRSVRQSMELSALREAIGANIGSGGGEGGVASHLVGDMISCCYYCKEIYERHQLNEKTSRLLYDLLGANHNLLVTQAATTTAVANGGSATVNGSIFVVDPQLTAKTPMSLALDKHNIFSPTKKHDKTSSVYQSDSNKLKELLAEQAQREGIVYRPESPNQQQPPQSSSMVSVGRPRPTRPKSASSLSATSVASAFSTGGGNPPGANNSAIKHGIGPTPAEKALEQMIRQLHAAGVTNPTEFASFLQSVVKMSPFESKSYDSSYDLIQRYLYQHRQELSHYSSYHSLPRGILYWRLFCLSHCMIIEHSHGHKRGSPSFGIHSPPRKQQQQQQLPKYFCLSYSLGQSNVYMPFTTECQNENNAPVKLSIDLSRPITVVPIKECRLHSLCANKKDLLQYFREKKIVFTLYSDGIEGSDNNTTTTNGQTTSAMKGANTVGNSTSGRDWQDHVIQQQRQGPTTQQRPKSANAAVTFREPKNSFQPERSSSPLRIETLQVQETSPSRSVGSKTGNNTVKVVLEGQFIVPLNKLNLLDDDVLKDGLTKEDYMIFFQSQSMGKVCIKLSLAMALTPAMPETNPMGSISAGSNTNTMSLTQSQGSFYREYEGIFWPPATFAPSSIPLPHAWMCMLTNHSNNQSKWVELADLEALHHGDLDSDDEDNLLLPLLDEELAKEERAITEEMQRIKNKQHMTTNPSLGQSQSTNPSLGQSQTQSQLRAKQNKVLQDAMLVSNSTSTSQSTLRKSLLRNSIVMDQTLLKASGGSLSHNNRLDMLLEEGDAEIDAPSQPILPKVTLSTVGRTKSTRQLGSSSNSNSQLNGSHTGNGVHRKTAQQMDVNSLAAPSTSMVFGSPTKKGGTMGLSNGLSPSPSVLDVQEDIEGVGVIAKSAYDIRKLSNVFIAKNKFQKAIAASKQQKSLLAQSFANSAGADAMTTMPPPTVGSSIVGRRSVMINQLYSQLNVVHDLPGTDGDDTPQSINIFNKLEAEIKEKQRMNQSISLTYHSDGIDVIMNLFEERVDLEEEKEIMKRRARHRLNKRSQRQFQKYKEKMERDALKPQKSSVPFGGDKQAKEEESLVWRPSQIQNNRRKKKKKVSVQFSGLNGIQEGSDEEDDDDDDEEDEGEEDEEEDEDEEESDLDEASISSTDSEVKRLRQKGSLFKGQCTFNHNLDNPCVLSSKTLIEKLLYVVFLIKAKYLRYKEEQEKGRPVAPLSMTVQLYSHRGKPIGIDPKRSLIGLKEEDDEDEEDEDDSKKKQEESEEVKRARRASMKAILGADDSEDIPKTRTFSSFLIKDKELQKSQVRLLCQDQPILDDNGNDIKIDEHEWKYLTEELIESMSLALKNIQIFEYLPSHLNWTLLKPLIIENLQLFIAEKHL